MGMYKCQTKYMFLAGESDNYILKLTGNLQVQVTLSGVRQGVIHLVYTQLMVKDVGLATL